MAEVNDFKRFVREIIEHYAQFRSAVGEVDTEVVIDESQGHFELMRSGWINGYQVHGTLIHVDIGGDKIWIQHDGTEEGVANELVERGVPKENIVLAFKSPELRKLTGFAVT